MAFDLGRKCQNKMTNEPDNEPDSSGAVTGAKEPSAGPVGARFRWCLSCRSLL